MSSQRKREVLSWIGVVFGMVFGLCTAVSVLIVGYYYLSEPWDHVCAVFLGGVVLAIFSLVVVLPTDSEWR